MIYFNTGCIMLYAKAHMHTKNDIIFSEKIHLT